MLRLISYVHSTADHMIQATVDPNESPRLVVHTDFDFASCPHTAKSTSGVVYLLKTGNARYPVLCSSKKQSSTARSTTEAELIACASALFGEVLNLHTMIESLVGIHVQQDNQAAITVMITGYSAKLRHSGRVHRVIATSTHEQLEQAIFTLRYCRSLGFNQRNWPDVCLTPWSLKLCIGHMCMYSMRGELLICRQNHAIIPPSYAHVVLPHFGCVPTYFGSIAVKTSVLAAVHYRVHQPLTCCG